MNSRTICKEEYLLALRGRGAARGEEEEVGRPLRNGDQTNRTSQIWASSISLLIIKK